MHLGHGSADGTSTHAASANGTVANGSSSRDKGKTDTSNGYTNGEASGYANGNAQRKQLYHGHNREEMVRLMMQALQDMGYGASAAELERESHVELESPSVAALRYAVLHGEWNDAELLLLGSSSDAGAGALLDLPSTGLPLKPGVDSDTLRLMLRRQKYLELLEQRDQGKALMVLRLGITPLRPPRDQLHHLSGLMVCSGTEELKRKAKWQGAHGGSRESLLQELSQIIHHSVIVPPSRLANLLSQTRRAWVGNCLWHDPIEPMSLFVDHICDNFQSPPHTVHTLSHDGEVFHVAFSHSGRYLAAAGKEKYVKIYEVGGDWEVRLRLGEHDDEVAYLAWSPDDGMIVTCCSDNTARLWDAKKGACIANLTQFDEPVTTVAWLPDGSGFVTGSLDKVYPLLLWNVADLRAAKSGPPVVALPAKDIRVQDVAITPDGSRLLAIDCHMPAGILSVFDMTSSPYEEVFRMKFEAALTCVTISQDGRYALLNLADSRLQCIEIATMEVVQQYAGQSQGKYVIRSVLGGMDENLVISGSEDGNVYVFHRNRGTLLEALPGHKSSANGETRCVNAIAWNPNDLCMFASCGDDGVVRIWAKGSNGAYTPATTRRTSSDLSFTHDAPVSTESQLLGQLNERYESRHGSS